MLLKNFADRFKNVANSIVGLKHDLPYWVEIITTQPHCIYYFGPFDSYTEAREMQDGYIEDLVAEKATGISIKIKRCMPTKLTITEEEEFAE